MSRPTGELFVSDYNGWARSGKDTIMDRLAARRLRLAKDGTGEDYRAIARHLLLGGAITPEMAKAAIVDRVAGIEPGRIAEVVARRHELVGKWGGPQTLYEDDVAATVSSVSPNLNVREAVKAGFRQRVASVVADERYDVLLVGGRNLAPVVSAVPGTKLIMRTFVTCSPAEAAKRELARNGKRPVGFGEEFEAARVMIDARNRDDQTRTLDRVVPDDETIDYKNDDQVRAHSFRWMASSLLRGGSLMDAMEVLTTSRLAETTQWDLMHHGAGTMAAMTGEQILFDTTFRHFPGDPAEMMVDIAGLMLDEAVEIHTLAAQSESAADELFNGTRWWSDRYYDLVGDNAT